KSGTTVAEAEGTDVIDRLGDERFRLSIEWFDRHDSLLPPSHAGRLAARLPFAFEPRKHLWSFVDNPRVGIEAEPIPSAEEIAEPVGQLPGRLPFFGVQPRDVVAASAAKIACPALVARCAASWVHVREQRQPCLVIDACLDVPDL